MNTRFTTNILLAVIGSFLLVASFAFAVGPYSWIMLGGGIAAVAISVPAMLIRSRGQVQRGLDLATAVVGAWTIIASLVFVEVTMTWLGFASGAAFAILALAGLILHERSTERVVHSLEVKTEASSSSRESGDRTGHPTVTA